MPSSCRVWTTVTPFFAGSPRYITDKLQCVLNAAARLVTGTHKFDHGLSHLLHEDCTGSTSQNVPTTNWESQCIAVCRTRLPSTWSTAEHQSQTFPADVILRSATRHHLTVPRYRLGTFGRRAFSVAGLTVWNSLPDSLRDPALTSNFFRQSLKTNLFRRYHSAHTAQ